MTIIILQNKQLFEPIAINIKFCFKNKTLKYIVEMNIEIYL